VSTNDAEGRDDDELETLRVPAKPPRYQRPQSADDPDFYVAEPRDWEPPALPHPIPTVTIQKGRPNGR